MEQLSIFDLDITTATIDLLSTEIPLLDTGFTMEVGTKVVFGFSKNAAVYQILEDDSELATVKFTGIGYRHNLQLEEMTVKSNEIKGIIDGDDVIQLPQERPTTLNLEFYRNRAAILLAEIANDRNKQMDFLTYYLLVSPSAIVNVDVEYVWNHLLENKVNRTVEYRIFSLSSYAQKHDFPNLYFEMFHTGAITVKFDLDKTEKIEFHVSDIIAHFYKILERISTVPIEELSQYELMLLYRKHGYLLMYKAGTDEWYFQHPDSREIMPVLQQSELYNVKALIEKYESKYIKHTFNSTLVGTLNLDDFEYAVNQNGFTVPSGTIVQLTSTYGFSKYIVIEDNGEKVKLRDVDDYDNVITLSSTLMTRFYPYENQNIGVKLPSFNRPKSLTIETLVERDTSYYHSLSEKEFMDAAVYRAVSTTNQSIISKIIRALKEGNSEYANELIKSEHNGVFSTTFRFDSRGNIKKMEFGFRDKSRDIDLKTNEITKHLLKMLSNTVEYPFSYLSIAELQLAYHVRGYKLSYDTVTDEFNLSKGIDSFDVNNGRSLLNDLDKTIHWIKEKERENKNRNLTK